MESGLVFNTQRYSIHDGPGIRTTVFLKGCPLRCAWCHNPEGLLPEPELILIENRCLACGECGRVCPQLKTLADGSMPGREARCLRCGQCAKVCPTEARQLVGRQMKVEEVMVKVLADRAFYEESAGGVTFSGGEPFMQPRFLRALLEACRSEAIDTAVDTSGYVSSDELLSAAPLVDLFLYDLKVMDDHRHRQWTGVSNAGILENLRALGNIHHNIWIRVPLVPGFNDDPEQVAAAADFAASVPGVRQVNLLPYHAAAAHKWKNLCKPVLPVSGRGPASSKEIEPDASPESESSCNLETSDSENGCKPAPFQSPAPSIQVLQRAREIFLSFGLNTHIGG